jgi:glycosyltransferase involved in cell wall biosynthesis
VIGYGVGGMRETIINGGSGLLVQEQTVEALLSRIKQFEALQAAHNRGENKEAPFTPLVCRKSALRFASANFRQAIDSLMQRYLKTHSDSH